MLRLCGELFGFLCLSELGDKSQISTVTIAAVYNLYAVLRVQDMDYEDIRPFYFFLSISSALFE